MRRVTMLYLATAASALAGCNQPAVSLKAPAFQSSENTVRDWNDVARKIGAGMAARGLVPDAERPLPPSAPAMFPVFVRVQAPDSAFVRDVADELESDILRRGGMIARTSDGATVVNLDVNFVKWGPRDKPPGPVGTMVAAVALPAVVIGASTPMAPWVAADAAASSILGVGILADGITAMIPTANSEAVWQATIISNDRVVMKLQEPIYVREPTSPSMPRSRI